MEFFICWTCAIQFSVETGIKSGVSRKIHLGFPITWSRSRPGSPEQILYMHRYLTLVSVPLPGWRLSLVLHCLRLLSNQLICIPSTVDQLHCSDIKCHVLIACQPPPSTQPLKTHFLPHRDYAAPCLYGRDYLGMHGCPLLRVELFCCAKRSRLN